MVYIVGRRRICEVKGYKGVEEEEEEEEARRLRGNEFLMLKEGVKKTKKNEVEVAALFT